MQGNFCSPIHPFIKSVIFFVEHPVSIFVERCAFLQHIFTIFSQNTIYVPIVRRGVQNTHFFDNCLSNCGSSGADLGAFGHVFGLSGRFAREWCHFMHYQSQNAMVLCTFQRKSGFRCGVAKVLFQNVAKHIVFSHYLGFGGDLGVIWG